MEIDQRIANIIKNELQLAENRVVVYGQNFTAPSDEDLYVVVSTKKIKSLGNKNEFDQTTNEEIKTVNAWADIEIELTSKNRSAYERKEELNMALTSTYSIQQQDEHSFKLFRGELLDLTFIEGSSSLYRFVLPLRVTYTKVKRTVVPYFDKLREFETEINRR